MMLVQPKRKTILYVSTELRFYLFFYGHLILGISCVCVLELLFCVIIVRFLLQ